MVSLGFLQYILLLAVAYSGAALGLPMFMRFLREAGPRRTNYAGQEIPLGAGLYFVILLPPLLALAILAGVPAMPARLCLVFAFAAVGFGLAGFIDDALGSAHDKGFRGHFKALLKEGRLTSGALKALFGGAVALLTCLQLAAVYPKVFGSWYQILLNTMLLASAANLINLFDLRPGRAGKVFLLGLALSAAFAVKIDLYGGPVLLAALIFIPVFRQDLRARLMLGDTGANYLGAVLGMAMVFWLTWHAKAVAVVLFLALQLASERFSFTALIERVSLLRILDRWGRRSER
ncbi:MAG: hypothetical protein ACM3ZC_06920 [Bacteroidota bacterium]